LASITKVTYWQFISTERYLRRCLATTAYTSSTIPTFSHRTTLFMGDMGEGALYEEASNFQTKKIKICGTKTNWATDRRSEYNLNLNLNLNSCTANYRHQKQKKMFLGSARQAHKANNLTADCLDNVGSLTSHNPICLQGLLRR
jgi:hypothetical protein